MPVETQLILDFLYEKRGLDFSGYRASMLERRISKRIEATQSEDKQAYLEILTKKPGELDKLIDVLTINVSRFLHDTLIFEYIGDKILMDLVQESLRKLDRSIRIWSAGCSMGEEPFSVAILLDKIIKKEKAQLEVDIFATDIDKNTLNRARAAVYPPESIDGVKYGILKQYFVETGEGFTLIPETKKMVKFSFFDLLDNKCYAPPESVFASFDMVLCRNVIIYYKQSFQNIIFEKLYRSLRKGGYLVLGEAEIPLEKYQRYFQRVGKDYHIYQKV